MNTNTETNIYLVQHVTSGDIAIIAVDGGGNIVAEAVDIYYADAPGLIAAVKSGDDCHMRDPDRAVVAPTPVDWSQWRVLA